MNLKQSPLTRRNFLRFTTGIGIAVGLEQLIPAYASRTDVKQSQSELNYPDIINLQIQETRLKIGDRRATALTVRLYPSTSSALV